MKKKLFVFIISLGYEVLRLAMILTTRPEFSIDILPASWYAAVPLLAFPIVLVFLIAKAQEPNQRIVLCRFYLLTKILSGAGIFMFCMDVIPFSISYGHLNDFYSIKRSLFLMIFLLIDAILCTMIFIRMCKFQKQIYQTDLPENPDQGENEQCR